MTSREYRYLVVERCGKCGKHLRGGIANFIEHNCKYAGMDYLPAIGSFAISDLNNLINIISQGTKTDKS